LACPYAATDKLKKSKLTIVPKSVVLIVLIGLMSCATNKNNWRTRGYHRLNTHYNGYYYAREAMKDGLMKINKANLDDYSQIIPLFVYPNKESGKMASGDMDKAVKKCTSAIERHMITDKKNVEIAGANNWIDDCYLTIGQARFYKLEYFGAIDAFEYVTKKYVKWDIHYDGFLWLIRTYNETSIFSKSEELITLLKDDRKFPKNRNAELYALAADYNIRREQWQPAIGNLTKAITLLEPLGPLKNIGFLKTSAISKNKDVRSRYIYVLAQLYEKMGDTKKADDLFAMVVKMRPRYDMEFNARLNQARLYDFAEGKKGEEIKAQLLKMIKDFKNEDYRDQIYYTLAGIELREKNESQGISYLKASVRVSTKNPAQKTRSYLKLADLNYDKFSYKLAQAYYDSVVPLIKKDYPDYESIVARDKNLNDLIKNLKIITNEDSLQNIAAMDTAARNAFIDMIIAQVKENDRKKEEEKQLALHNGSGNTPGGPPSPNAAANQNNEAGSWYFYNSAAISFGLADFRKKWGDRKLEDNWRRLSKESNSFGDASSTTEVSDTAKVVAGGSAKDPKKKGGPVSTSSRDFYLKSLPLTQDAKDRSNLRIVDAYYNAGMIYKEALMNNPRAAAEFEEMLSRFPNNKYVPTAFYFLYRIYIAMEDQEKADRNRNIILTKYPDSELVPILKNPENVNNMHANQDKVKTFYTETYTLYTAGNYGDVIKRCETADSLFGGSKLGPKFLYLKALAIGHTGDVKAYEVALTAVTVKYPKDDVKSKAQGMIDAIHRVKNGAVANAKQDSIAQEKKEKFFYKEDVAHCATIVVKYRGLDATAFKTNLSNFNQQYFSTQNLTVVGFPLNEDYQIFQIKEFTDKRTAMFYYEYIKGDKDVFRDIPLTSVEVFAISIENFRAFYNEKNTDDYKAFFNANYLRKNP
jgi:tetratricopeptide (TPR) repeat protein